MKDVMIDLETMGKTFNAPILQFGGIYFDRHTGELKDQLQININLEGSMSLGFTPDASTIKWWMGQSDEARKSILKDPEYNCYNAIHKINDFLKNVKNIWSHATFDYVILMNHLNKIRLKPSFHYRSARDIRTLINLAGYSHDKKNKNKGTKHTSIDDCKFQIEYCVKCFNSIKERKIK